MSNKHYYVNHSTGELTYNHTEAMQWLRNGNQVDLYFERQPEEKTTCWIPFQKVEE